MGRLGNRTAGLQDRRGDTGQGKNCMPASRSSVARCVARPGHAAMKVLLIMMLRIGVDLGGTKIEIIALDEHGRELLRRRVPTPAVDYAETLAAVAELVTSAERELGAMATVGIGTPGAISRATGLLK